MATVQIKIAGTDRTANVVFGTASFESAVNGATGPCKFRVRDDDGSLSFVTGSDIELLIDGEPIWTGYLTLVTRVYAFPAENVALSGPTRWFDLEGTDLNILFSKRIVVRESDPENVYGKLYPPGTPDDEAIEDLVTDFLDLTGDGLDVSTMVENVADINVDQNARAWSSSYTWGQAMASISALPAAVYFLDPSRQLVYTDVNTPTAALGLSDQPGAGQAGYREMTVVRDGTNLANDVLAWGMGYGSSVPVFVRDEDATSQAEHGLWQMGVVKSGIYKQATINRVAESIVDGSPSSKRGHKDDRVAVSLVTHQAGFLPAQKVAFESNIFGFSDVIPIRKMKVTFEAPESPRYELLLSHAIDDPWSFTDPFFFDFNFPPLPTLPPFPPIPPPPPFPCPCGITDTFGRTVSISSVDAGSIAGEFIGTADCGIAWQVGLTSFTLYAPLDNSTSIFVDGTKVVLGVGRGGIHAASSVGMTLMGAGAAARYLTTWSEPKSFVFTLPDYVGADNDALIIRWALFRNSPISQPQVELFIHAGGNVIYQQSYIGTSFSAKTDIPNTYWQVGVQYTVSVYESGSDVVAEISDGATSYSFVVANPDVAHLRQSPSLAFLRQNENVGDPVGSTLPDSWTVTVDNYDISEINRCTILGRWDNFLRAVSGAFGATSSDNGDWVTDSKLRSDLEVSDGVARWFATSTAPIATVHLPAPGPWESLSYGQRFAVSMSADGAIEDGTGFVQINIFDDTSNIDFYVRMGNDDPVTGPNRGFIDLGTDNFDNEDFLIKTDWVENQIYLVELAVSATSVDLWLWPVNEPRPSTPTLTVIPPSIAPTGQLNFSFLATDANGEVEIVALNFDYPGRPCWYQDCGITMNDLFERIVAAGGWGVSPEGFVWVAFSHASGLSVDGTDGLMLDDGTATQVYITDSQAPWNSAEYHGSIAFEIRDAPVEASFPTPSRVTDFYVEVGTLIQIQIQIAATAGPPATGLPKSYIEFGGQQTFIPPSFWVAGGEYVLSFVVDDDVMTASVTDGISVHTATDALGTRVDRLRLFHQFHGPLGADQLIKVRQIEITPDCGEVPPTTVLVGPQDYGCETPTRLSPVVYQVSRPMAPNSSEVYLDGLLKRGQVDYVENEDRTTITFHEEVHISTPIRICYQAAITS